MKSWILFFLGTIAYFLIRYNNRKAESSFDFKFWLKDNWNEFLTAIIFDIAAMIILMDAGTSVDLTGFLSTLPITLVISGKLFLSFACGLGLGWGAYVLFKKKLETHSK